MNYHKHNIFWYQNSKNKYLRHLYLNYFEQNYNFLQLNNQNMFFINIHKYQHSKYKNEQINCIIILKLIFHMKISSNIRLLKHYIYNIHPYQLNYNKYQVLFKVQNMITQKINLNSFFHLILDRKLIIINRLMNSYLKLHYNY